MTDQILSSPVSANSPADIAFLGFAERAACVRDGPTNVLKWNVLGLKSSLLFNFFPASLEGLSLALGIRTRWYPNTALEPKDLVLIIRQPEGGEVGRITVQLKSETPKGALTNTDDGPLVLQNLTDAWMVIFMPLPAGIMLNFPGLYTLFLFDPAGAEISVGQFACFLVEPPPLTVERIAAIKSNPHAVKAIRAVFGCNSCDAKLRVYAGLDRIPQCVTEGYIWYTEVPNEFVCDCGRTHFDLATIRRNFFALVGQTVTRSRSANFLPMYEASALEGLRVEFLALLDRDPLEEEIQRFIERNPVLLHQFPADKFFCKPKILTRFVADFGIVTPQKELVLIEIEKASMRLLKSDGGQSAQLTHASDQVKSWMHDVKEHWLTVLETLNIARESVSHVKGIVIAGRDTGYDTAHMRRLKSTFGDHLVLLTYDDLAAGLAVLGREMAQL